MSEFDELCASLGIDCLPPLPSFEPQGNLNVGPLVGSSGAFDWLYQPPFNNSYANFASLDLVPSAVAPVEPHNAYNGALFDAPAVSSDTPFLENETMGFSNFPGNLECGPYNPGFGMSTDNMDAFTQDMSGVGDASFASFNMIPEAYFNNYVASDQFLDMLQLPPSVPSMLPSCSSSTSVTPELLTPSSSSQSLSPSPLREYLPFSSLMDPQPSLACPSVYQIQDDPSSHFTQKPDSPILYSGQVLVDTSSASSSAYASSSSSPSPSPSDSSSARCSSSDSQSSETHRKTRSSMSKATCLYSSFSLSPQDSKVRCTFRDCRGMFYDNRTRDRHVQAVHYKRRYFCPAMCRESGFSREDALNRHLQSRSLDSMCQIKARKLGWHPDVQGSVKRLRSFRPRPRK